MIDRVKINKLISEYADRILAVAGEEDADADLRERILAAVNRARTEVSGVGIRVRRPTRPPVRKTRKAAVSSPDQKLQGQYMGTLRHLSFADKNRVKAIREQSGIRIAIAAAQKFARTTNGVRGVVKAKAKAKAKAKNTKTEIKTNAKAIKLAVGVVATSADDPPATSAE